MNQSYIFCNSNLNYVKDEIIFKATQFLNNTVLLHVLMYKLIVSEFKFLISQLKISMLYNPEIYQISIYFKKYVTTYVEEADMCVLLNLKKYLISL